MACPPSPSPQVGTPSIGRTSAPHPDQGEATPLRSGGGDSCHGQGGSTDSEGGGRSPNTPRRAPRCSHRGIVAPRAIRRRRLPRRCLRGRTHSGRTATSPAQASAWLASHVGAAREAEAPSLDELSHLLRINDPGPSASPVRAPGSARARGAGPRQRRPGQGPWPHETASGNAPAGSLRVGDQRPAPPGP
jgi:hypothetical protein